MKIEIVLLFLIFLGSCSPVPESVAIKIEASNTDLALKNGVLFYKDNPFTGRITEIDNVNGTKNISNYKTGLKEGLEFKYYDSNQLAESRNYHKGKKIGLHEGFYNNGQKKFSYQYESGVYHGSFKQWYASGQLLKDFNYVKGKEVGSQKMWNFDGTMRANYVVKNGERFGLIGLKKCYSVQKK